MSIRSKKCPKCGTEMEGDEIEKCWFCPKCGYYIEE